MFWFKSIVQAQETQNGLVTGSVEAAVLGLYGKVW